MATNILYEAMSRNPDGSISITMYSPDEPIIKTVSTFRARAGRGAGARARIEANSISTRADGTRRELGYMQSGDSHPSLEAAERYMEKYIYIWGKWGADLIRPTEDELVAAGAAYVDSCDTASYWEYKGLWFATDLTGRDDHAWMLKEGERVTIGIPGAESGMIIPAEGTRYQKPPEEAERQAGGLNRADLPYTPDYPF